MKYLPLLLLLFSLNTLAQKRGVPLPVEVFRIDSLPAKGILLDKGWKWHAGDNPDFAKVDFDDSKWESIDPTQDVMDLPQIQDGKIGWMRIRIKLDSSLIPEPFGLTIIQVLASEIYADGRLIERFGELNSTPIRGSLTGYPTISSPINLPKTNTDLVIAIRFAFQKPLPYNRFAGGPNYCFNATVVSIKDIVRSNARMKEQLIFVFSQVGAFFILFILHLVFFILYPRQKTNLYFSGMALLFTIHSTMWGVFLVFFPIKNLELLMYCGIIRIPVYSIAYVLLLTALYSIFDFKKNFIYWLTFVGCIILLFVGFLKYKGGVQLSEFWTIVLITLASIYIVVKAILAKKRNSTLIFWGLICSIIGLVVRYSIDFYGFIPELQHSLFTNVCSFVGIFSISISISWFLGADLAFININLEANLKEVHQLSTEKQQILSTQNETLEKLVNERTAELKASQNQLIQKEKLASLGELTAGIAHEIQNPLNFVNNFSEMSVELAQELKEEAEKPEIDKELIIDLATDLAQNQQKINHHGKRASSIVSNMLEHSRTSTGERVMADINKLADEYLRLSYHGMRAKNKDFSADYELIAGQNLPLVNVVPQDIGRVFLNLINNAFYAVSQPNLQGFKNLTGLNDAKVMVSTKASDNAIEIKVADNGTGMNEKIKAKIFQPFFTTKPTGEGTGLGLSLAYDIITKGHGGTLEVETKEGEGTTLIVKLPIQ